MLVSNKTENQIITFIPYGNWSDKIDVGECVFSNDIYRKYKANLNCSGELIVCDSDETRKEKVTKQYCNETYDDYLNLLAQRDADKDRWVYNILDGTAEQDNIIYKDDHLIVIPNYTWNGIDKDKMHILVFATDKSLRSIRSLRGDHVQLLQHMKDVATKVIMEKYGHSGDILKMFFHYIPSTYHLHLHVVLASNRECNSSVEYSHELSSVIYNLTIKTDYYQEIVLRVANR
jgi:m7GpppX diphosphatase